MSTRWVTTKHGGIPIVVCTGEIGFEATPEFSDFVVRAAQDAGNRVIVDLTGVPYMESAPIGALLSIAHMLEGHGGRLATVCAGGHVRRVIRMMGLESLLLMSPTVEVAYDCVMQISALPTRHRG